MKKVIMLLVDSLMPDILDDALRHKTVPALQFLIDRGRYWPNCVTVFPTMTASVDSSLLTGEYPDAHKVPGLIWYDPERKEIVNYINGFWCAKQLGFHNCIRNALYNLNEKHLSKQVTTIFEELAARGKTSAAINAMIHRSVNKHPVKLPFPVDLATGFRLRGDVSGPEVLTLGKLVESGSEHISEGNIPRRYSKFRRNLGVNDSYAVHAAKALVRSGDQPDFMLVYLPDNDHTVHIRNPAHGEGSLIKVDRQIQDLLNEFGTWDDAIDQCVFIIISDHGQTRIGSGKEYNIDLDLLLQSFRVLQLGEPVRDQELAVANNERMAYIYPLKPDIEQELIRHLVAESRLDIIAWKDGKGVRVKEGGSAREMYFEPGGRVSDVYGRNWNISGEWKVLDLTEGEERVEYGDYPDVLSRLYGALYSQNIPVIVTTTRPRYELKSKFYPTHLNGGSHGSLHKYDSLVPLIVAGTDHPVNEPPRLVDMKHFVVELFEDSRI
ncbi:alkaline phosphatase family protein [Paenibacillus alkalitolerans]|uniref:alkaline phosphatase family protein n=1 Tax=Paenibacillus alkalitolerans TaxID=2799335 RepID=UPI0018F788E9|nr:alkaline phosphatase family protein [Paenibacillus alkalitolerans]